MRIAILLALALAVPYSTPTGDVLVETVSGGPGKPREGIGRGIIDAPPERVFRALTDYEHWDEFMPFLTSSDAKPQADGTVVSEHRLKLPVPLGERHYRVRFRQRVEDGPAGRVWRIDWAYVPGSGDVAGHRGSWTLIARKPGRTLGVCRLWTDSGDATPLWAVGRGTAQTIPWIFHGLRQHVRRSRYAGRV
ncbi:MAG: SRPBCC family protein [Thermoanaerobaculia bacterium]